MKDLLQILKMSKQEIIDMIMSHKDCLSFEDSWLWIKDINLPYLVAHIDNVYEDYDENWHKRQIDIDGDIISSPQGIAGDDRCGIYALITLYDKLPVNCIFTDYEENHGIGATKLVQYAADKLQYAPYFIEIDRRGCNECVFYNNEDQRNPDFVSKITRLFDNNTGTFSDIQILGSALDIASVNLSAGYYYAHEGPDEYIKYEDLMNTINKIPALLELLGPTQYNI